MCITPLSLGLSLLLVDSNMSFILHLDPETKLNDHLPVLGRRSVVFVVPDPVDTYTFLLTESQHPILQVRPPGV